MIKGVIYVLLAGGLEVPIPAAKNFDTVEQCQNVAMQAAPIFLQQFGGQSVRFTCEPVK